MVDYLSNNLFVNSLKKMKTLKSRMSALFHTIKLDVALKLQKVKKKKKTS